MDTLAILTQSPSLSAGVGIGARPLPEPCPGQLLGPRVPYGMDIAWCAVGKAGGGQVRKPSEVAGWLKTQGRTNNTKRKPTTSDPSLSTVSQTPQF